MLINDHSPNRLKIIFQQTLINSREWFPKEGSYRHDPQKSVQIVLFEDAMKRLVGLKGL